MNALELKPARAAMSTGILNPTTLAEALQIAEVISKSSIVPKDYQGNPGNVLVAIQWGMEIGLAPLQAMQNIAVINGRPSLWGDAMLALCKASPLCEYVTETIDGEGDAMTAVCVAKRRGDPSPVVREFSMADAKKAALYGKQGPWQQYPKRMLQMRARGYCLRDAFPDVLKGMAVAEEETDKVVSGTSETTGPARPASAAAADLNSRLNIVVPVEAPPPPADMNPETGEVADPIAALLLLIGEARTLNELEVNRPAVANLTGEQKRRATDAWKQAKVRIAEYSTPKAE